MRVGAKTRAVNSPLRWVGAKRRMVKWLLKMIPRHTTYVEVFGGVSWLLLSKKPSMLEIYNDVDDRLVNFYKVCREPEKVKQLINLLKFTPYSRTEFKQCLTPQGNVDEVEAARRFFVTQNQGFGGNGKSWGYNIKPSDNGNNRAVESFIDKQTCLLPFYFRLKKVTIENNDFRKILSTFDSTLTFFYCDPPYYPSTRTDKGYRYEMTKSDHSELIDLLLNIKGKCALSGYQNKTYEKLEKVGWDRYDFSASCSLGHGNKSKCIESVWINYKARS